MNTSNSTISITSTSLHFREGNSDKEYHATVEPEGEGYIVTFAYGRRGATLTTGRKTQNIVTLTESVATISTLKPSAEECTTRSPFLTDRTENH